MVLRDGRPSCWMSPGRDSGTHPHRPRLLHLPEIMGDYLMHSEANNLKSPESGEHALPPTHCSARARLASMSIERDLPPKRCPCLA